MNLGDGSEISDDTEHLVDLQEHGEKWSSSLGGWGSFIPKTSKSLQNMCCDRRLSRDPSSQAYLRVRKLENILISQIDQERVDT